MSGNIIESSLTDPTHEDDVLQHSRDDTLDTLLNPSLHRDTMTQQTLIEIPFRRNGQRFDNPQQKAQIQALFLEEFSKRANVTDAAAAAGISRETAYRWLRDDPQFADCYAVAEQEANDVLRRESWRRAVEGTSEPIVSMGKLVRNDDGSPLTVQKYDTPLLMMLMRARMPEYRDSRQVTVDSNVNVNTSHQLTIDTRGMSQDDLASIRAIAERMKAQEQARIDKTGKADNE